MGKIEGTYLELVKSVTFASQSVEDVQKVNSTLSAKLTETISQLESAQTKLIQLEESTLHLERYSRSYNLRFGGIPELENEPPSYPYDKINKSWLTFVISNLKSKIPYLNIYLNMGSSCYRIYHQLM